MSLTPGSTCPCLAREANEELPEGCWLLTPDSPDEGATTAPTPRILQPQVGQTKPGSAACELG